MEFCSQLLLLWTHEVMVCQAASATTSLQDALIGGPLCLHRTLDPRKIAAMALNCTRPGHGTSLVPYLGVVVIPKCSNRARSLPVGIEASALKDSTLSTSWYIFLTLVLLGGGHSPSVLSSTSWSSSYCCSSVGEP
jgi:hypothetical protein